MGAELLHQAADELDKLNDGPEGWAGPVLTRTSGLLRAYARQERYTEPEDGPVDAAIHDLAQEILR